MSYNTPKFNFGIRPPEDIININKTKIYPTQNIQIDKLIPFKNHPFKLYEGERFKDMCDSIKQVGVIIPIIVREIGDGNYEILSGHNRTEAAKVAGLTTIPAIVRDNLSDEEAMVIFTETNLIQRSFTDLSHSERALILATHYRTIKHQGMSELIRSLIYKQLGINGANDGVDFIRKQIREEIKIQLKAQIERLIKVIIKIGMIELSSFFYTKAILKLTDPALEEELWEQSRKEAAAYLGMRNSRSAEEVYREFTENYSIDHDDYSGE